MEEINEEDIWEELKVEDWKLQMARGQIGRKKGFLLLCGTACQFDKFCEGWFIVSPRFSAVEENVLFPYFKPILYKWFTKNLLIFLLIY